jgi:hypothetical protein
MGRYELWRLLRSRHKHKTPVKRVGWPMYLHDLHWLSAAMQRQSHHSGKFVVT